MSKPTPKKIYPLLLLILILIFQAFVYNDDACSASNSVCFHDFTYTEQVYHPDKPDIPHINDDSFIEKSDDVTACITCGLLDNKKDFLFSDTFLYCNALLNRHLGFPDNHINQSIQKKNILYQSSDDPLIHSLLIPF